MQIVEQLSTSGATDSQIVELERMIGSSLPYDYRRFLSEVNGGRPSPNAFEGPTGDGSVLNWFFTLNQEEPIYFLPGVIDAYNERIPPQLLPIATDPFGNVVVLDVGAKSVGAIYFWDHENENPDGDPWWENISFIAPSFTEFVNGLH
jgi:cell wall assembly regulator SMI1